ncbi:MAG: FtsX-like permease family protein [Galbitalea sp.]
MRYRVREIGIRRSFGATAARVFFSVMMESVVATFVAGGIGVIVAILLVENPLTQGYIARAVVNVPAFPFSAAVIGMVCSVGVGALAGLLPALVAVRVKVIDAIRF